MATLTEEICFELRDPCGPYVYLEWLDQSHGWALWCFDRSQAHSVATEDGEKIRPYVYDVQVFEMRERLATINENRRIKLTTEVNAAYYKVLMNSIFSAITVRMYAGIYDGVHQRVQVKVVGGSKSGYTTMFEGVRRFELEIEMPQSYTATN